MLQGHTFPYTLTKKDKMTLAQVKEFNTIYDVPMSNTPTTRVVADKLRFDLIAEELQELRQAVKDFDIVEVADALGDIQYVAHGAVLVFGLEGVIENIDPVFPEDNALITNESAQSDILHGLKVAILRNNVEDTAGILRGLLICVERAAKFFDIDLEYVVNAIHKSNLTKLGENGEVIRRPGDNKVLKGPNYSPPTGDIHAYLYDGVRDAELSE